MPYVPPAYQPARGHQVTVSTHRPAGGSTTGSAQARIDRSSRQVVQQKRVATWQRAIIQRRGLPANLQAGIERLSGMSMANVQVHYNSAMPAQVGALAYAQGNTIYVAPGQAQHLAHEAWHVVQQRQGRVKPTMQVNGLAVNDNVQLEREADVMGARANWG